MFGYCRSVLGNPKKNKEIEFSSFSVVFVTSCYADM
ncbi:unnamed protein product [Ixodes pacificus]